MVFLYYLVVKFTIDRMIVVVDQLECVGPISIHEAVSIWRPSVCKGEHQLMHCLLLQSDEVPEHVCILNISCVGHIVSLKITVTNYFHIFIIINGQQWQSAIINVRPLQKC